MAQQFPKDRFDVVPSDLERVGAHRAPHRRGQGLMWLAWCLVAVIVIVGAGWVYLRVLDRGTLGASPAPLPSSSETASAPASATPTPTPTPTATLVPSATVRVLNGAGVAGLAGRAGTKLKAAGWTAVTTGNASQSSSTTGVFYSDPGLRGVALGVAQSLGTTSVTQSDAYASMGAQIVVVLGADYSG